MPWSSESIVARRLCEAFPTVSPEDVRKVVQSNRADYSLSCYELLCFFPDACVDEEVRKTAKEVKQSAGQQYANVFEGVYDNIMANDRESVEDAVNAVLADKYGELHNDCLRSRLMHTAARIYVSWVAEDAVPSPEDLSSVMAVRLLHTPTIVSSPAAPSSPRRSLPQRVAAHDAPKFEVGRRGPDPSLRPFSWLPSFRAGTYTHEDCEYYPRMQRAWGLYQASLAQSVEEQRRARDFFEQCRTAVEDEVFKRNNQRSNGLPWILDEVRSVNLGPRKSRHCLHVDFHGLTLLTVNEKLKLLLRRLHPLAAAISAEFPARTRSCPLLIHCGAGTHTTSGCRASLSGEVATLLATWGLRWNRGVPCGVFVVDVLSAGRL